MKPPVVVIAALVCAAAGAGVALGSGSGSAAAGTPTTTVVEAGCAGGGTAHAYVELPLTQVNLRDGHFVAVQATLKLCPGVAAAAVPPGAASEPVIAAFSGLDATTLATTAAREQVRAQILSTLQQRFPGSVAAVLFVDLSTQ